MTHLSPETRAALNAVVSDPSMRNVEDACVESWQDGYNAALLDAAFGIEEGVPSPIGTAVAHGLRVAASTREPNPLR